MHISSNIKYLRKKSGLTQEELANRLDKTYITVGDYERGKILPPLPVILELCAIFDVNIDTLVNADLKSGDDPPKQLSHYTDLYEDLKRQYETLEQLSRLQAQRLADLERLIRKHAPDLAREIGL